MEDYDSKMAVLSLMIMMIRNARICIGVFFMRCGWSLG
jgi:hypothetical protein